MEDQVPYWRRSQRESILESLTGKNTAANYPEKSGRVRLSEDDPTIADMVRKAKSLKLANTDDEVQQLLRGEEEHREKARRHGELFAEGVGRMRSLVIGTLEDETFLKETEQMIGLKPGAVKRFLDKYQIVQRLESIGDTSGEDSGDKQLEAYKLGLVVQTFTGVDRVSQSPSQWGVSDTILARKVGSSGFFNTRNFYEAPFYNYRRESQGVWGTLLSLKFRQPILDRVLSKLDSEQTEFEFMVRERLDVVAGTSGMGLLKTAIDMIPEGSPTYYSNTSYFEIMPDDKSKVMPMVDIMEKVREGNVDSPVPLTVVLQPYSSSPGDDSDSLQKFLDGLQKIDGGLKRPLNLIVDATMVPVPVSSFEKLIKSPDLKNVRLTAVWSLIKHGQMGLDMTPGGVAVVYGYGSKDLREKLVKNNGFMTEEYAARLVPHSLDTMADRMLVAGNNAEQIQNYLGGLQTPYSLFGKPTISQPLDKEYGNGPCMVFLPVHQSFTGRPFPTSLLEKSEVLSQGTSYGFDKTRIELIPEVNGTGYLRIASGQEGPLSIVDTLDELTRYLEWSEVKMLEELRDHMSDLEYKVSAAPDDERIQWMGFTEDDRRRSKVLLISAVERFGELPQKAQDYLTNADYQHSLENARRFAVGVSEQELTELLGYLLKPLLNLKKPGEVDLALGLEIDRVYPGLRKIADELSVGEQGEVDSSSILKYLGDLRNRDEVAVASLRQFFEDYPVKDDDGNSSRVPRVIKELAFA